MRKINKYNKLLVEKINIFLDYQKNGKQIKYLIKSKINQFKLNSIDKKMGEGVK